MPDALTVTIIFIALSAFVSALIRGRKKDKCLKCLADGPAVVEFVEGPAERGRLRVETTGLEVIYDQPRKDALGHLEMTGIIYKAEFPKITAVVRPIEKLTDKELRSRQKQLRKTYHPGILSRLRRKTANIFRTVRDSVAEVITLLISQAKRIGPASTLLTAQDKYISKMQTEVVSSVGTSYEPLLERYIGSLVVAQVNWKNEINELSGVLRDYSPDFLILMDVNYGLDKNEKQAKVDIVLPRTIATVRHYAE